MSVTYNRRTLFSLACLTISNVWEDLCDNGYDKNSEELCLPGINTNIKAIENCFNEVCDDYNIRNRNYTTYVFWCDNKKGYVFVIRYTPDDYSNFDPIYDMENADEVVYSN